MKGYMTLFTQIDQLISDVQPDSIAVEDPFVSKNAKTAIAIGHSSLISL